MRTPLFFVVLTFGLIAVACADVPQKGNEHQAQIDRYTKEWQEMEKVMGALKPRISETYTQITQLSQVFLPWCESPPQINIELIQNYAKMQAHTARVIELLQFYLRADGLESAAREFDDDRKSYERQSQRTLGFVKKFRENKDKLCRKMVEAPRGAFFL